jgi:hypothetical protein
MRRSLFCVGLFVLLLIPTSGWAGESKFLLNSVGDVRYIVETANTVKYRLSPAEAKAFHQQLQRLGDLLKAQPVFNPPHGVQIRARALADDPIWGVKPPYSGIPVVSIAFWSFQQFEDVNGKPTPWTETPTEMIVITNNLDGILGGDLRVNDGLKDSRGNWILLQLPKVGELHGFPVYRNFKRGDTLVLTRRRKPYWLPVSQEEYLKAAIRQTEEWMVKTPPPSNDPYGDAYRINEMKQTTNWADIASILSN